MESRLVVQHTGKDGTAFRVVELPEIELEVEIQYKRKKNNLTFSTQPNTPFIDTGRGPDLRDPRAPSNQNAPRGSGRIKRSALTSQRERRARADRTNGPAPRGVSLGTVAWESDSWRAAVPQKRTRR